MKNLKHTPGPWKYDDDLEFFDADDNKLGMLTYSEKSFPNIKLIAAAPEMFDGIKKFYQEIERIKSTDISLKDRVYLDGVLAIADNTIKNPAEKATGQTIEEILK